MDNFMQAAVEEALLGMKEGGVPIGSVLVVDGEIVGRGHNRQRQMNSIIRHA
ncbi:MAG: deaminase, partial [Anaerolineales bacterium]